MTLVVTVVALGAGAVIDARTRRIPNALTFATAALGVGLAGAGVSHVTLAQSLAGLILGMLFMLPGYLLGATGAGDVKLLGAAGAVLGVSRVPIACLYTAIAGGILALGIVIARRRVVATARGLDRAAISGGFTHVRPAAAPDTSRSSDRFFAYGPAIAAGCIVAALGV